MSSGTEREATTKVATRCAMSSPAHTSSQALTATIIAGFILLRHPLYLADLTPSDFLFVSKLKKNREKMEIYWRQWCYLHCKWHAWGPRSRILLQWHTGFGESLDQVHFCRVSKGTMLKSGKISCSYSVVNCIRLRTFWTPLVLLCVLIWN